MSLFYNPKTRRFPVGILQSVEEVTPESNFYRLWKAKALPSRKEALESNVEGYLSWLEDGKVLRGHHIPGWDCKTVTEAIEPVLDGGINWGNAYFTTEEAAQEWVIKNTMCRYDISYVERGDVWWVHYHY